MNHLREIRAWMGTTKLAGLVVPSTDEFLSEFPPHCNRRLQWATGFRGSTGMAVILRESAALFVDGRYSLQATTDIDGKAFSVESVTYGTRLAWLKRELERGARIGLDPWLHSVSDVMQWRELAAALGFGLEILPDNPIDLIWTEGRPAEHRPQIVAYPECFAGESWRSKCAGVVEYLKAADLQGILVADPEDVSWLLNVRAAADSIRTNVGDWHIVPSCTSRALVSCDGSVTWFVDTDRLAAEVVARGMESVTIVPPHAIATTLGEVVNKGRVCADLRRTPEALGAIIAQYGQYRSDDTVARRRWRKHRAELASARRAHVVDAAAVVRFMAWLDKTITERVVDEFEAAQRLVTFRAEHPDYIGPSMPLMSASGASGAQPHYVPRPERARPINDHPIYWMDSGGQYFGGSTDNTLTLAVGTPQPGHVLAHTLVLQGYIALATARFPVGTYALALDTIARQPLWREGMDFVHGAGHGVGNYLNIHEGPVFSREPGPYTTVALEPGMIVTNEPAYYKEGDFGLRIESHMIVIESPQPGFLEFETISRLPIDPRLVAFERLSITEREWLAIYHRTLARDLTPLLAADSAAWLESIVQAFNSGCDNSSLPAS